MNITLGIYCGLVVSMWLRGRLIHDLSRKTSPGVFRRGRLCVVQVVCGCLGKLGSQIAVVFFFLEKMGCFSQRPAYVCGLGKPGIWVGVVGYMECQHQTGPNFEEWAGMGICMIMKLSDQGLRAGIW